MSDCPSFDETNTHRHARTYAHTHKIYGFVSVLIDSLLHMYLYYKTFLSK